MFEQLSKAQVLSGKTFPILPSADVAEAAVSVCAEAAVQGAWLKKHVFLNARFSGLQGVLKSAAIFLLSTFWSRDTRQIPSTAVSQEAVVPPSSVAPPPAVTPPAAVAPPPAVTSESHHGAGASVFDSSTLHF